MFFGYGGLDKKALDTHMLSAELSESKQAAAPEPIIALSVSGGGLHSHSAASGLFAGMIDALGEEECGSTEEGCEPKQHLDTLLKHVTQVSGNSGGAWFITQLAFFSGLERALEDKAKRDSWDTEGYLGQVTALLGEPMLGEIWLKKAVIESCKKVIDEFYNLRLWNSIELQVLDVFHKVFFMDLGRIEGAIKLCKLMEGKDADG